MANQRDLKSWMIFSSVSVLTPLVIIFTIIRAMMTTIMLDVEYRMPGFPADPYGFSMEERLKWSKISVNYLLSNDPIQYFDQFSLGDGVPLYNARELSHMSDVKYLVTAGRNVWLAILCGFSAISLFSYLSSRLRSWYEGIRLGGYFTIGLILLLLLSTFLDFNSLFTQFHALFFTGDSWIFYYSDTFIRLFPIRFWMDLFIYIGVLSAILGIGAIWMGNRKTR